MFPGTIRLQGAGESRRSIPARPASEGKAFCLIAAAFAGCRPRLSISRGKAQRDLCPKMAHKAGLCAGKDMYQRFQRCQRSVWRADARLAGRERKTPLRSSGHDLFIKS